MTERGGRSAAVIVSTYNRPDALAAVLEGLLAQERLDFEIAIADDGSGPETAELIGRYAARGTLPIRHVWQEDRGFRAAEARNRAVAATGAPYLIFLDGDCVPLPHFVRRHLALAERGYWVTGNRVMLGEAFTREALASRAPIHAFPFRRWLLERLRGRIPRLLPLLRLPAGPLRKLRPRAWDGAKSCNLGVWRDDFAAVNGFDERYRSWGYEDSDLVIRLIRAGVRRKEGRFALPVLHLWHPLNEREQTARNLEFLAGIRASDRIRAEAGLDRHVS